MVTWSHFGLEIIPIDTLTDRQLRRQEAQQRKIAS
jgi:hypothetical protein